MNIEELQAMGGFVDTTPVPKEIKWKGPDGQDFKAQVHIVRQPFGVVENAFANQGDGADRSHGARMIHLAVRFGKDASEQLTYEQAYNLHPGLAWALVAAFNNVHVPKA